MPYVNDYTQLAGLWKDVWGATVFDAFKFATPIISDLPLDAPASQAGGKYHQPIMATLESGITHAAQRTTPGYGSAPFIGPRAGVIPDAQIEGVQMYGRSLVTYEAMMRSLKDVNGSEEDLKKAVKAATRQVVMGLGKAMAKRAEVLALNGNHPDGLGVIEAVGTTPTGSIVVDGVTGSVLDVSVSAETWAAAIFAQSEGASFDIFASGGTSKLNTVANTALAGGSTNVSQTGFILYAVNPASPISPVTATGRVLRFWHNSTAAGALNATTLAVGGRIFYESGGPSSLTSPTEPNGLSYLASIGTGSPFGTSLYNIDSATYSIWGGNRVSSVGNVKLAQLIEYMAAPIDFGIMGEKVRALVPTKLFQQFATDEASLRRYNGAQKKADNGFDAIQYSMGGNNVLEVLGHPYQKGGRITCYIPSETHRVGPQDISFLRRNGSDFSLEVAQGAASEARAMGQYNIYLDAPKHALVLEGVTY